MFLSYEGVDLAYEEYGSGEPLLLIHGSGAQAATWGRTTGDLAAVGHRVIAYDRRGYGASAHSPVRDHRRHVVDAVATLEHVAMVPATVLGWSAGGNIALALTAARPDLVRRLIVVEPPFHGLRRPRADLLRMVARAKWAQLRGRSRAEPSTSSAGGPRSRTAKHPRRNATGCSAMPATSWRSSTRTRTA